MSGEYRLPKQGGRGGKSETIVNGGMQLNNKGTGQVGVGGCGWVRHCLCGRGILLRAQPGRPGIVSYAPPASPLRH